MTTPTHIQTVHLTLGQAAEILKKLSKTELETLELLLDKEASRVIKKSVSQAKRSKVWELSEIKETDTSVKIYLKEKKQKKLEALKLLTDLN